MKELIEKIKEALISALPITAIVYLMSLTPWFDFSGTELVTFSIGAVLLIVGIVMNGGVQIAKTSAIPIFIYILAASIVSYCLWFSIVKGSSLSDLFVIKFAEPLFSCILGAFILGENIWDVRYLIAFVLIGGGITVAQGIVPFKKH